MRTQDIEIILGICERGSFSKVAESIGISQPAVSLAVKRMEEEFGFRFFDRAGPQVSVSQDGKRVLPTLQRVMDLLADIKSHRARSATFKLGLSPILSGRDVAQMFDQVDRDSFHAYSVEFLDSVNVVARTDFDVRVVVPTLRRRSSFYVDLQTIWIGANNGVFIQSTQESDLWQRARHVLLDHGIEVKKTLEVNDCGYAYHLASSGAGFSPCVLTHHNAFKDFELSKLPPLPPTRLDIFAPPELAIVLRNSLSSQQVAA
ncbi:LysR family transcriptional regulator [Chthonobacter albigriseus]|uniref:LysR family transcriptional regulator n=1 Tax=Chthonobacter albigriseus TaxID=1683161 RepID=UPI0015EE3989